MVDDIYMIPIGEVPKISLDKGKISSFNLKNKVLKIRDKTRTSTKIGVSIDQSTSKNHNYFILINLGWLKNQDSHKEVYYLEKNIKKCKYNCIKPNKFG